MGPLVYLYTAAAPDDNRSFFKAPENIQLWSNIQQLVLLSLSQHRIACKSDSIAHNRIFFSLLLAAPTKVQIKLGSCIFQIEIYSPGLIEKAPQTMQQATPKN